MSKNTPTNTPTQNQFTNYELEHIEQSDIQRLVEAFQSLWESILDMLRPLFEKILGALDKFIDVAIRAYPNKRVLHLAMHHPKERVRKKNMHRIMRWMVRGGKK